uniref:EOG090X06TI n=1 Tax=Evadne anonyx TaxID=141404 RepID=A0A9N6WQ25_9CRUS|nr:EOG090X06TI [Evadne anonyx]
MVIGKETLKLIHLGSFYQVIIHLIKLAKLSQQRKDFKKTEQLLHLAFRSAQDLGHQKAQKYIIDEMANNAYELGDFRKAEKLFKEMMRRIITDGTPPNDNAIIHISAKLACLYGMFKDDLKANEGFKFCISNLKEKLIKGADDFDTKALYCLTLSWYGEYLHSTANNVEALNLFQESLEISKSINGPSHPHSLLQLNNMAAAYSVLNQLDDAANYLKETIRLSKEQLEYTAIDLPYYYINLANIYLTQLNNPSENSSMLIKAASDACTEAFQLAKKAGDKEALMEVEKCRNGLKKHVDE